MHIKIILVQNNPYHHSRRMDCIAITHGPHDQALC
jgi:hypothetical protein